MDLCESLSVAWQHLIHAATLGLGVRRRAACSYVVSRAIRCARIRLRLVCYLFIKQRKKGTLLRTPKSSKNISGCRYSGVPPCIFVQQRRERYAKQHQQQQQQRTSNQSAATSIEQPRATSFSRPSQRPRTSRKLTHFKI